MRLPPIRRVWTYSRSCCAPGCCWARIDRRIQPDRLALTRLRHALERQMLPEGAFRFALHDEASPLNVWATMFSDQALCLAASPRLAAAARDGDPLLV